MRLLSETRADRETLVHRQVIDENRAIELSALFGLLSLFPTCCLSLFAFLVVCFRCFQLLRLSLKPKPSI